jgi:methylated-DNA-protein-cysteine methyltransferase-like protein
VVNRVGLLTAKLHFGGNLMQTLLENEGVKVENDQVQDFKEIFWDPMIELAL